MSGEASGAFVDDEIVNPLPSSHIPPTDSTPPAPSSGDLVGAADSLPPPPPPSAPPSLPRQLLDGASVVGLMLLHGLEYVGEVFADLLGITASRYQYVIDAKEREERRQRMEDNEEEEARQRLEQRMKAQQALYQQTLEEGTKPAVDRSLAGAIPLSTSLTPAPHQAEPVSVG